MNHSSGQQSMNQLRRNTNMDKGSLGKNIYVDTLVAGIMRVGFERPGAVFITEEDVTHLPDFFKRRLQEISGENGEYSEYARISMVSGFSMAQILEEYFRITKLSISEKSIDINVQIKEVLLQLGMHDCFPSEKCTQILGTHLGGLDTYVFSESLYSALRYVLLNKKF